MKKKYNENIKKCVKGLASVVIPVYNREMYIVEALNSVVNQLYRPIEIVVVDDGSSDNTVNLVKKFYENIKSDKIYFYIYCQENKGACCARNNGFSKSNGEFIQFLDSDDYISEDKISDGVKILSQDMTLDFVYSLRADFDSDTKILIPWRANLADLDNNLSVSEVALKSVSTILPLFRRSILEKTGVWNETLSAFQDWEYIGRVVSNSKNVKKIDKVQAYCRQHAFGQISKGHFGDPKGLSAVVEASKSLLLLVANSQDYNRVIAMKALKRRCISAIRVAIATGQNDLAVRLISQVENNIYFNKINYVQIFLLKLMSYIPSSINKFCFKKIIDIKNKC